MGTREDIEHCKRVVEVCAANKPNGLSDVVTDHFETTDFVQVKHHTRLDSEEPSFFWRNALYVTEQNGNHVVIYTDGTKCVLKPMTKIRKAVL